MPAILACTDGSAYASSVCHHAAWAALRTSASVEVLHVINHHRERAPSVDVSGALGPDAATRLTEELVRLEEAQGRVQRLAGQAILEAAKKELAAAGIPGVTATQRHGSLVETLAEFEKRCDLVVIGKRGTHADFAKGHLGGNLERVIRAAIRPVLVASRAFRPIDRFIVAYDGGPSIQRALAFLGESPLLRGTACLVLRAGHADDEARWYLGEAAAKLREAGYAVSEHIAPGDPVSAITEVVAREGAGLVVMGAYGHSPIRNLMLGSTTTAVVRTCLVPVFLFR